MSRDQTLQITVNATAGGFSTQATLYGEGILFSDYNMNYFWDTASSPNHEDSLIFSSAVYAPGVNTPVQKIFTTVLPYRVYGNSGTFKYYQTENDYKIRFAPLGGSPTVWELMLYSTSSNTTTFSESTWNKIAQKSYNYWFGNREEAKETLSINNSLFHSALSFAVRVRYYDYSANDYSTTLSVDKECSVYPVSLNYNTTQASILATNAAIGNFRWVSIDGGLIG